MMQLAKVAAGNPDRNTVDIVMASTGEQYEGVRVSSSSAGTRFGNIDIPQPDLPPSGDKWDLDFNFENDVLAVVSFLGAEVFVMGFVYPEVSQMLFKEQRSIRRHASDVYESIDGDGNYELSHPSGTYIRIGTSSAHEDLTGKDVDAKWAIDKNTDKEVNLHLSVHNAGTEKAFINIAPDGGVTIKTSTKVTVDGNAEVNGNAKVKGTSELNTAAASSGNIVTTLSTCAFLGAPHPAGSSGCKAGA